MPWQERSMMSERQEFVILARQEGANIAPCAATTASVARPATAGWPVAAGGGTVGGPLAPPAWLAAAATARRSRRGAGAAGSSTRPGAGASCTTGWRARAWPTSRPPAPSPPSCAATAVLAAEPPQHDFLRFEHAAAERSVATGLHGPPALPTGRVHPWTLLDDHSRFALVLAACANEQQATVKDAPDDGLSPLRAAVRHPDRQRLALGHRWRGRPHRVGSVVAAAGGRALAWPPLPSPDPGQGRALPRHHLRRGLGPARPDPIWPPRNAFDACRTGYNRSGPTRRWTYAARQRATRPARVPSPNAAARRLRPGRCRAHGHRRRVDLAGRDGATSSAAAWSAGPLACARPAAGPLARRLTVSGRSPPSTAPRSEEV